MSTRMPVGGHPNLHVALALRLGRPTSWTDAQLLADLDNRCLPVVTPDPEPQRFDDVPLFDLEPAAVAS